MIRLLLILSLCTAFSSCTTPLAVPDARLTAALTAAGDAYESKDYKLAAAQLKSISQELPDNPVVYYNLANAYFKSEQIPLAIYNYEKALLRKPGLEEARDNLAIARKRIPGHIGRQKQFLFVKWWQNASTDFLNFWSVSALLFFLLLMGVLLKPQLLNKARKPLCVLLTTSWLVSLGIATSSWQQRIQTTKAVVMQSVAFTDLPGSAKLITEIPAGVTVRWLHRQNGFSNVQLPDGRKGWANTSSLALVD